VYCDTRLIVAVLERLAPAPTLYPGPCPARTRARCDALVAWAEGPLFRPLALYVTGLNADRFEEAFHADRARLHGKPVPTTAQVHASAAAYQAQVEAQLGWIEDLLAGGDPFLFGAAPSLADFALYEAPWFLELIGGPSAALDRQPRTRAWMQRVAAIGHGRPQPMTAMTALARARAAAPAPVVPAAYEAPEGVAVGERVTVVPFDQHAPATGRLAAIDGDAVTLHVDDSRTGEVAVHFPRLGYRVRRARD
jgi:glutathione S-transferase